LPHIYAKSIDDRLDLPLCNENFEIHNSFANDRLRLYFVTQDGVKFAITQRYKDGKYLLKYDKHTRPSSTNTLSKALLNLANALKCEIDNTNIKVQTQEKIHENPRLIKPDFFMKNCDFLDNKQAELEIGFGSGRHLLAIAKASTDKLFFGVEIYKPAVLQLLQRAEEEKIDNIFVVDFDARLFLQTLSDDSLDKIHIHFPVPWNDAPHRRVFSKKLLDEAFRVLKNDGSLELRSDDEIYFQDACKHVLEFEKAEFRAFKNRDVIVSSKYEDRWKKHGKDIFDLIVSPLKQPSRDNLDCYFEFAMPLTIKNGDFYRNRVAVAENGIIVKFEEILLSDDGSFVVKIVFGSVDMPENKYIYTKDNKSCFYPDKPLLIADNIKAFKKLEEIVYGKSN
jgi:tRNA (guanine-N7-)-methyltransferase